MRVALGGRNLSFPSAHPDTPPIKNDYEDNSLRIISGSLEGSWKPLHLWSRGLFLDFAKIMTLEFQ